MLDDLLARLRQGDRLALSRVLTLAARGEQVHEIAHRLGNSAKSARVVAITGSAGVGKSSLAGKMIDLLRNQGMRVAVLACDPQSPLSGGALLGDRFRMPAKPDDGVFIRSLATVGGHHAIAENLRVMFRVLDAFGFDVVLVETVGAGQGDTAVRELSDVVVLLVQPESGDDLQWEKAGVLEVSDVVVVHKADLPGAEHVESQVKSILGLTPGNNTQVLRVSAKSQEGLEDLWRTIAAFPLRRNRDDRNGHDLLAAAQHALAHWFESAIVEKNADLEMLVNEWHQGQLTESAATNQLWTLMSRG